MKILKRGIRDVIANEDVTVVEPVNLYECTLQDGKMEAGLAAGGHLDPAHTGKLPDNNRLIIILFFNFITSPDNINSYLHIDNKMFERKNAVIMESKKIEIQLTKLQLLLL